MTRYYLMNDERILAESSDSGIAKQLYDVAFHCGFYTTGEYNIVLIAWNSCKDNKDLLNASFMDGNLVSYSN